MQIDSVKKNYFLNLINTVTGLLFPIITFPYAARILLADGIGQVQFFDSIISYITLLSSLGIPLYAVREIAKVRDNAIERNKTATEILIIHSILSTIAYVIVYILIITVSKIQVNIPLFAILSTGIFFNAIGVNWFYQALEEFRYITILSISVKTICTIALFVFVKSQSDLLYYGCVHIGFTVGSNVFNFIRLRKYMGNGFRTSLNELQIFRHIIPAFKIFFLNLVVSIYLQLSTVMLGFIKNELAVGYYAAPVRITKMALGIITSLEVVILPRLTKIFISENLEEFKDLIKRVINFAIALVLPMSFGLIILSEPIIELFCGPNYVPSIITMQLVAPSIIFIGISTLSTQILYSQGKEKIIIKSALIGALINFILNISLMPILAEYGAALSMTITELIVLSLIIFWGRNHLQFNILNKQSVIYLFGTIIMTITVLPISMSDMPQLTKLLVGSFVGTLTYVVFLILIKDELYKTFKDQVFNRVFNSLNNSNK